VQERGEKKEMKKKKMRESYNQNSEIAEMSIIDGEAECHDCVVS